MKLHLHTSPLNLVTQYGDGYLDEPDPLHRKC